MSALGNVNHLEISFCEEITDVGALGRVNHLKISIHELAIYFIFLLLTLYFYLKNVPIWNLKIKVK